MTRQHGYSSQVLLKRAASYGVTPAGNFTKLRFDSNNVGSERGLIDDPEAGLGRDPKSTYLDAINVNGDMRVPVDMRLFGIYLTGLLGDPVTTGAAPKVHTFKSGAMSLPSYSMEIGHSAAGAYYMEDGIMFNTMTLNFARSGPASATFALIGKKETRNSASQGGVPIELPYARASQFQGSVKKGGNILANLNSASLVYSNNLETVETLTTDGTIEGIDPGMASLSGTLNARFSDTVLLDAAMSGAPVDLEYAYTLDASNKLVITIPEVYLAKSKPEINGPGGIAIDLNFKGQRNAVAGYMMQAALTNDQAGTVYTS